MKRFEFKLMRVLQYRERLEEQAKNTFEQTLLRLNQARSEMEALARRRTELLAGIPLAAGARIDLLALTFRHACGTQLRGLILAKRDEIVLRRQESEQARQEWTRRRQEAEVIRKIKEKKWKAYLREADKEEQKASDDHFLAKVAREYSAARSAPSSSVPWS